MCLLLFTSIKYWIWFANVLLRIVCILYRTGNRKLEIKTDLFKLLAPVLGKSECDSLKGQNSSLSVIFYQSPAFFPTPMGPLTLFPVESWITSVSSYIYRLKYIRPHCCMTNFRLAFVLECQLSIFWWMSCHLCPKAILLRNMSCWRILCTNFSFSVVFNQMTKFYLIKTVVLLCLRCNYEVTNSLKYEWLKNTHSF